MRLLRLGLNYIFSTVGIVVILHNLSNNFWFSLAIGFSLATLLNSEFYKGIKDEK